MLLLQVPTFFEPDILVLPYEQILLRSTDMPISVDAKVSVGLLLRKKDGKYTSVVGTKGYRWKESDIVKNLNQEDQIDLMYYNTLVNDAIKTIEKFGPIDDLIDYSLHDEPEELDLIGFDETAPLEPIANAMYLKGEK